MDITAWLSVVSIVISLGAATFSGFSYWLNRKMGHASIESSIATSISDSKIQSQTTGLEYFKIKESPESSEQLIEVYRLAFDSSKENYLNQYELACQKYVDGKVDKKRFKKSYSQALYELYINPEYKEIFDAKKLSYPSLRKLVTEFHNQA
ncbi:hypothetical protein V6478_001269 [Providencia rettgeri]|uniref:hypothetical protein n=1 Tax=Providencia sp. PROV148 TaxID=2949858 RepID=UPI00234AF5FA|nr:hypothetical protein [Providencia sp. PROV148]EJD6473787.1 hypothetical protein [Providencia rettgeri]ELR5067994.1 hypothetical protein [Providencia rettgeri]ELR5162555.1 hypothetical protein [Providencia rettgeri]